MKEQTSPRNSADPFTTHSVRRVQLQLDVGDTLTANKGPVERPRPVARRIGIVLQGLLPDPSRGHELAELTAPDRAQLYRMAGIPPMARIQYEEGVRRAVRARYGGAAA
jgi:hypothetical protein